MEVHQILQDSPSEPGYDLPRVVAALMFWSDVTQLSTFVNAKLWPLYIYFGNESKYHHCKPSFDLCTHIAYFQKLPDKFKDFSKAHAGGKVPRDAFFSHYHRELFHEQWKVLLDEEFLDAYQHGIVITSCDDVTQQFYLRIFIYSGDYPEN
ncbi:hypothetical protein ID866_12757 [Astraeus odoratus]|nr:hypothetical protein ID866_12757 [Astraeus odoratus]